MSTGAEYSSHRPRSEDARIDETFVRILFVEERSDVADEVRRSLGETGRGSFEVVRETSLVRAAAQIRGDSFDLLLVDPQLPDIERSAVLELANDLAHRLPVVSHIGDMVQVHLHLAIAHPACHMLEYIPWLNACFEEPATVIDGDFIPPQNPGAGTTLTEAALEAYDVLRRKG